MPASMCHVRLSSVVPRSTADYHVDNKPFAKVLTPTVRFNARMFLIMLSRTDECYEKAYNHSLMHFFRHKSEHSDVSLNMTTHDTMQE
jgi:hypothetical protein